MIEHPQPGKSRHYGEWRADQEGKPTYHSIVRDDVDEGDFTGENGKTVFPYPKGERLFH